MSFHVRYPGFSLIELLVVLGIVAVLLAILLPTISVIRQRMKMTTCMNNLRQLGVAINTYRADCEKWPGAVFLPTPFEGLNPDRLPPIYEPLIGYVPAKSEVYRCPADLRVWPETAAASAKGLGISYGYVIWDKTEALSRDQRANFPIMGDVVAAASTWVVLPQHPGRKVNSLYKDGSVDTQKLDIRD